MNRGEIEPFRGVGDLRFGTSRGAIRSALGNEYTPFYKTQDSLRPVDSYDGLGFHLHYDEEDVLEFIEAFPPCRPTFEGIDLLADPAWVVEVLARNGHRATWDDPGIVFEDVGFALYVPLGETEAVSVYRRGYYD